MHTLGSSARGKFTMTENDRLIRNTVEAEVFEGIIVIDLWSVMFSLKVNLDA